ASASEVLRRNPITGGDRCCARATSGHAVVEPAIPLMKSRRRIACPVTQDYADDGITAGICERRNGLNRHFAWQPSFTTECPTCAQSRHSITYSIIASAPASKDWGREQPRAFAVFRLTASSYLFGACASRSGGFSPLRMRST